MRAKKKLLSAIVIGISLVVILICGTILLRFYSSQRGYRDYTVQMEQYFVQYSGSYFYDDVITVEYPVLEGIPAAIQDTVNDQILKTAMDRVSYWHLSPDNDVKAFQQEYFSIFASDVSCDVPFHSQYLLSLHFSEWYCTGNPVWYTNGTERALTFNLLTGQSYALSDIIALDTDFVRLWDRKLSDENGITYADEEELEFLLSAFLGKDDELLLYRPFFYLTDRDQLVIGIAEDPILDESITYKPYQWSISTEFTPEELEALKKDSDFWDYYARSEETGSLLPCPDKKENIWLGANAGIWNMDSTSTEEETASKDDISAETDPSSKGDTSTETDLSSKTDTSRNNTSVSRIPLSYPVIYNVEHYYGKDPLLYLTEQTPDYVVEEGDNLWDIADKLWGDGSQSRLLADLNSDIISDPDMIYPDMVLTTSRTGYLARRDAKYGGMQWGDFSFDFPYGWTTGTMYTRSYFAGMVLKRVSAIEPVYVLCRIRDLDEDTELFECIRYITASFAEHYDPGTDGRFRVNDYNLDISPETEWPLAGMFDSFAFIDDLVNS